MRLLLLFGVLPLIVASHHSGSTEDSCEENEDSNAEMTIQADNFVFLAKEKCDSLNARSYFDPYAMSCYVMSPKKRRCSLIRYAYGSPTDRISNTEERLLAKHGLKKTDEDYICAFKLEGSCPSGDQIGDWCYTVVKQKKTFVEASEHCESIGSSLVVVHNDNDIKKLQEVAVSNNIADFWIGAGTKGGKWQFHDRSEADFFRFKPNTTFFEFLTKAMGLVFYSKCRDDFYEGYLRADVVKEKYSSVCARRIADDYYIPSKYISFKPKPKSTTSTSPSTSTPTSSSTTVTTTTKKRTTTSTTTTTTTTPVAKPMQWIIGRGTILYRTDYNTEWHHYTTIASNKWHTKGYRDAPSLGYVVSEKDYPAIRSKCPELVKMHIWRVPNGYVSKIGKYRPYTGYEVAETFYCAPRQFYCDSNFRIRQISGTKDWFYGSTEKEQFQALFGLIHYGYTRNTIDDNDPCWIWQRKTESWYSQIVAGGQLLYRSYHDAQIVHHYTITPSWLPPGFKRYGSAGYVVSQEMWNSHWKYVCPQLIPHRIYHGNNAWHQMLSFISSKPKDGWWPAGDPKNPDTFYCAPYFNYCNANFELRRMDRRDGKGMNFFYPSTNQEAAEQLSGKVAPFIYKNTDYTERVCWVWQYEWEN